MSLSRKKTRILNANIIEKKHVLVFKEILKCVFLVLTESVDYGPVFVQEPDDIIFPTDSDEKKVALNCEVRSNPVPNYR